MSGYSTSYALEQWWSTIPPISTKQTTISHFKPTANKNETYDVGNPGPVLGQAQKCGRVKTVNGIATLLLLIIECGSKTTNATLLLLVIECGSKTTNAALLLLIIECEQ